MGVRVSLDDFGTGYSSLSYLHSFPLDKIKIDRSFLRGIGTSERSLNLLRGVARLSSELGMAVVVEGVETEEQLQLISAEPGVDQVQGYLYSPAVPAREAARLLALPRAPRAADMVKQTQTVPLVTNIVPIKSAASMPRRRAAKSDMAVEASAMGSAGSGGSGG